MALLSETAVSLKALLDILYGFYLKKKTRITSDIDIQVALRVPLVAINIFK